MIESMFDTSIPVWEILLRLVLAMVFSMSLGWERERREKPAGLKTHMLVAVGAAGFIITALEMTMDPIADARNARLDPTRVIQGVIGGIGFLGAGTIIQSRGSVRGLTTGASIWLAGGIGVAVGAGYYVIGALLSGCALFILVAVQFLERHVFPSKRAQNSWKEEPASDRDDEGEDPR